MTNTVSQTVSDETLDCIIQIESGGRPNIKAQTSSALGLGQFLNATWLNVVKTHRPDVMRGRTQAQILALRTEPRFAIEMLARFTEDNQLIVGRNCMPGDLYLAHFLGAGTAMNLFRASPDMPVSRVVKEAAIEANESILRGKTCGEVRAWAASKMKKNGGRGWVRKFYGVSTPAPEPSPLEEDEDDEDLRDLKTSLKGMNYNPGLINGKWGGMTAGAISGFLNDYPRGEDIPAPTSLAAYLQMKEQLAELVNEAEAEPFVRPVTMARKSKDINEVVKVAPEAKPVAQAEKTTFWGAVSAGVVGILTSVQGYLLAAWNWLTGGNTDPETLMHYAGYLKKVPPGIWILLLAALIAFVWWKVRSGRTMITEAVATGQRQ